jgi:HK97 family phage portal protein
MGIFNFMNKREETPEVTPPVDNVLLQALLNDEPITKEKALTLPSVSSAVDFISSSIASMPVKLYKYKNGKVEEQEKDTRVQLLNGDTGDMLDAFQMKKALVMDYLLDKGGYCYIQKSRNEVTALKYVKPEFVSYSIDPNPLHKNYTIYVYSNTYKPYEFIKLLRNTDNGAYGTSTINEVSKALETAYSTLIYQLGLVKSGGNKKGFIKSQRKLGQEEINILKQAWNNLYKSNSENVVVLNNGLEFQESSNSSVEMQMSENRKTLNDEINSIFHIKENFYDTFKEAIYPIVKAFETQLNNNLLLEKEKKNMFFEFDVKEIIKANIEERYSAYKTAKETGFMTLNEIRKMENMEYIEGLNVVNVGLGAVLYDTNTHQYYTPNTGETADITNDNIQKVIEDKEIDTAFEQSGNSSNG